MSSTAAVCGVELRYVSLGDIIDPDNHRSVYDALTCTANNIAGWTSNIANTICVSP
jgi:hypothetical protein